MPDRQTVRTARRCGSRPRRGRSRVLVERARRVAAACQRGDDEARIGAVLIMRRPCRRPAASGQQSSVDSGNRGTPGRCTGREMLALGRGQFGSQRCLQAGVACQAEYVTDAVRLAPPSAPRSQSPSRAQHDAHLAPLAANPCNDARHFLDRAGAAGNVGAPLPRQQQVPAAEA